MDKLPDFESIVKKTLTGFIKWFAWFVLVLGLIVGVFVLLVNEFDLDFNARTFTLFAAVTSIFSLAVYFTFQADGKIKGRTSEDYIINRESYLASVNGRKYEDLAAYLIYARQQERTGYINEVCRITGLTEAQIKAQPILKMWFCRRFTLRQKRHMKNIILSKYPNTLPKSPAVIMNVLVRNPRSRHGVDPDAARRYLAASGTFKTITTLFVSALTGAVAVALGGGNWLEICIKLCMLVFSLAFSLYGGYMSGRKSTSEIEKDILASMLRLLADMDEWIASGSPKPVEQPTPEPASKEPIKFVVRDTVGLTADLDRYD